MSIFLGFYIKTHAIEYQKIKHVCTIETPDEKQHSLREKCPYSKFFWSIFSRIPSECGKIPTRKTPNKDTFLAVIIVEAYFKTLLNIHDRMFLWK